MAIFNFFYSYIVTVTFLCFCFLDSVIFVCSIDKICTAILENYGELCHVFFSFLCFDTIIHSVLHQNRYISRVLCAFLHKNIVSMVAFWIRTEPSRAINTTFPKLYGHTNNSSHPFGFVRVFLSPTNHPTLRVHVDDVYIFYTMC